MRSTLRLFATFSCVYLIASCDLPEDVAEERLVDNLPSYQYLTDSLSENSFKVAKCATNDGEIIYSNPQEVDWYKELESLKKINVNHQRYRDSYTVTDNTVGQERTVRFVANEASQEVRQMEIRLRKGRIIYYLVEKHGNSLFSESFIRFEFTPAKYVLTLKQSIHLVFENEQIVQGTIIPSGDLWLAKLNLGDTTAPIQLRLDIDASKPTLYVVNGEECIGFNQFGQNNDTLIFGSDYFDSEFRINFISNEELFGNWVCNKTDNQKTIPLTAQKNVAYRFKSSRATSLDLTGTHSIVFYSTSGEAQAPKALKLNQTAHVVSGSILTETGDYRFLEGVVRNDSLLLSTMDGTHAYLFAASINDGHLEGMYYTGSGGKKWTAELNKEPALRSPESLTSVNNNLEFSFAYPSVDGEIVSLSDFRGTPVIVSVMGTWCSNCLDEAVFLKEAYELYHSNGLEIVALDFELISDSTRAFNNITRLKKNLGLPYPILLASLKSTKEKAHQQLPALSEVISYPTMIVLDRNHNIVKIHTGFNGPATGQDAYGDFKREYLTLFKELTAG